MEGRSDIVVHDEFKKHITFRDIQNKIPDRTYYIKDKARRINSFFKQVTHDIYNALLMTFSFDQMDLRDFEKYARPILSSGLAILVGELVTNQMSSRLKGNDESAYIYKFYLGTAILLLGAGAHRITEHRFKSDPLFSATVACDVLSIWNLYSSVYRGSRIITKEYFSNNYSLIASLGMSGLIIPGSLSILVKKIQELVIKYQYKKGSQRSDTALFSSGLTSVSNAYFLVNYFLIEEMATLSRSFQAALISHNILYADKAVVQFRNFPALLADIGPPIIKKINSQFEKIQNDYEFNTAMERLLKFTDNGIGEDYYKPRYQLRNGELVFCDEKYFPSMPVSGEIVAYKLDSSGRLIKQLESKKFSVNLKAHNGEDIWIEQKTSHFLSSPYKKVDLHEIHSGRQHGVLVGTKLKGDTNFLVHIKEETERTLTSNFEKKSIIDQIIAGHKRKNVLYSIGLSLITAGMLYPNLTEFPENSVRLLFNLYQMLIQFSETFLRECVNNKLLKEDINKNLLDFPMKTIDALRLVDFCNAASGYYSDKYPQGVAIVSDKTGTLTTSKMDVLDVWTADDKQRESQPLINEDKKPVSLSRNQYESFYEVFISAFTNSNAELEPEEFAILHYFEDLLTKKDNLKIDILGNNRFRKTYSIEEKQKVIETYHLGLFRNFGGRLTLVNDSNEKFLVFCGIPKNAFQEMPLFKDYYAMAIRKGVLSRDWCIARVKVDDSDYSKLKDYFDADNKFEIDKYLINNKNLLRGFVHYCTFLVNNPVKKDAEKFISRCNEVNIPVFIATGDTAEASQNIARVLCPDNTKQITIISTNSVEENVKKEETFYSSVEMEMKKEHESDSTIILKGINLEILSFYEKLLQLPRTKRPVIIFSEMSTEGKGLLTNFLRDKGYFVVANGDSTNDIAMMQNAHVVIAHLSEKGTYAPKVAQFADLNDQQLRHVLNSYQSFYELFDINKPNSHFLNIFASLANSQEKNIVALLIKAIKIGFELTIALEIFNVREMWQQHWFSVLFDLAWMAIAYYKIVNSTALPMDKQHLGISNFPNQVRVCSLAFAFLYSMTMYTITGESTNRTSMAILLVLESLLLDSIFSGYGHVRDEFHKPEDVPNGKQNKWYKVGFFDSCLRRKKSIEKGQDKLLLEMDSKAVGNYRVI